MRLYAEGIRHTCMSSPYERTCNAHARIYAVVCINFMHLACFMYEALGSIRCLTFLRILQGRRYCSHLEMRPLRL